MGPEVPATLPRLREAELRKHANKRDSIAWSIDFEPEWMHENNSYIFYKDILIQRSLLNKQKIRFDIKKLVLDDGYLV